MGKINVLDKHVAELIAAGEVVERPASVAKELVENAVDAGATGVTVEIRNGGTTFLRVADDGCGIAREDVPLAFLSHATSKISGREDLDSIATLGFRGEALASVAAVARVELLTRTAEELAGTHYVIDGEGEHICEDAGCPKGTTFVVRDLFYNTPARMKFLKKDVTEGNAVAAVVDKAALSHPEVSFRFLRDGRETLHTPGDGRVKSAVYAVYGKEFTSGMIPVEYELNGIRLSGFVCKPSAARPNRSMQNFFINGRFVRTRTASVALEEAFKGSLMVGKIPSCVLHLRIPLGTVDVNVHPTKLEVRFINEKPVFDAVYHGVKTALNRGDTPTVLSLHGESRTPLASVPNAVQIRFPAEPEQKPVDARFPQVPPPAREKSYAVNDSACDIEADDLPEVSAPVPRAVPASGFGAMTVPRRPEEEAGSPPAAALSRVEKNPEPVAPAAETREETQEEPERLIGEAFGTYIVLERGECLVFVDKHAAHERMLYEKLKNEGGDAFCQMLLEPVTVTLEKNEYSAVLESLDLCRQAGFELEDFGGGTVLVRSAPMILNDGDISGAVMEIAGYLAENKNDLTTRKVDWLYHNVACRAAVKAGDNTSPMELALLARRVEREDVRYCPHGRPVSFLLRKKDLERQFGRIQ
ncbi:DNA mismatch repair endonuclease MutL [Caproicibacter fermentans]|uniref:DNA mismatch repair protein MutL n=1 Tax=Caproicibacter fermentans TaxID=2576756 RepID=A0A7G8TBA6_9FIRM|nr:DNA mismatch repair endonuclease MutL [Caproicibacter fermentans]QNK40897.1 DNA mismatch repair endonuclease MutL [Caproicibacter fermentans]